MTNLTWKRMIALLAIVTAFAAAGCNTFRGVGEDFKAVGRAIQGK